MTVFYNQEQFVDPFFNSFLSVYGELPCQLIIGDNNSSDQTARYLENWQKRCPGIKLVFFSQNHGFACSNNCLAELADSDIFLFLNPDISFDRPFIAGCLAALAQQDGIIAPMLQDRKYGVFANYAPFYDSPFFSWQKLYYQFLPLQAVQPVDWVQGAAFFVSRDLFYQANTFDENYWLYTEDMAFCRTCSRLGFPVHVVRDYRLYHKKTVITEVDFALICRNLTYYFTSFWPAIPYLLHVFITELLGFSPPGRFWQLWKSLFVHFILKR